MNDVEVIERIPPEGVRYSAWAWKTSILTRSFLKLDQQIQAATELAALKPLYFRLNEIIQAYPGDFDVQFIGNDVKQHLMTRGRR